MTLASALVELRPGTAADVAQVSAIMAEAFDPQFGEAWTSAQCMGALSLPGSWLTLALRDGAMAGFALARSFADDGELLLLAVRPPHRRRGVGAALLRAIIAEARARDVTRLHLEVRAGNPGVDLYRAHGFAQIGTRREYYRGDGGKIFDAHTYTLALA